jgi:hypothetical protein
MVELPARGSQPKAEILLILATDQPIAVDDLSRLFGALAKDYKQLTRGRTLIVTSISHGSIIVHLTDAYSAIAPYLNKMVDAVKGLKALADFVKTLKESTERFRHQGKPSPKLKKVGDRSAVEIFKIASKTGRSIEFRHQSADGELLEVRIGPEEARESENLERALPTLPKRVAISDEQSSYISLEDLHTKSPRQIADAILTISSLDGPFVSNTVKSVIETVKSAFLLRGTQLLLNEVASYLIRGGRGDLARLLEISPPVQEPPLLA